MSDRTDIVPFEPRHAADFKRLNLEWLERHFRVEPIDVQVLSRPQDILRDGGAIWLARQEDAIVGCCALIARGDGAYELSKMAVTTGCQGQGLGRRLLESAVAGFRQLGGRTLFLETNSALTTAIALYESAGFEHRQRPTPSPYERANVYMVHTSPTEGGAGAALRPLPSANSMHAVTLRALAGFPDQLEAHFAAFAPEFTRWAPPSWDGVPSEPLTALEQLCHVRDIETLGYQVRIRRTLAETHPTLASIDTDALVRERAYARDEPARALAAFRAARAETVAIICGLSDAQLARTAVFEGYGPLTLRSLIHYLCSHDQQHLAGLQWLLGKAEASRLG